MRKHLLALLRWYSPQDKDAGVRLALQEHLLNFYYYNPIANRQLPY